jgi:predicted phosphodiesterase
MSLQEKFRYLVRSLPHLMLPPKCLVLSDFHAGAGDDYDPLKAGGSEALLVDTLREHQSKNYALLVSEVWDTWRGIDLEKMKTAHSELAFALASFSDLFWVRGNHEMDFFVQLPIAYVFEGFGKKVFFDHGWLYDWPNCDGWKIGRFVVQAADTLGLDPESSPHPSNQDRHLAVVAMRQELADANPEWDFIWGHTHWWANNGNNHNSGCAHHTPIKGFVVEEGSIIPFERS